MKKECNILIYLWLILAAFSCGPPEYQSFTMEGSFDLEKSPSLDSVQFSSIIATGASMPVPVSETILLPFNTNSDTVSYLFQSPQRPGTDTLTVSYKRKFELDKKNLIVFEMSLSEVQVIKNTLSRTAFVESRSSRRFNIILMD